MIIVIDLKLQIFTKGATRRLGYMGKIMEKNAVFASKQDRFEYLGNLSAEIREPILEAVEKNLADKGLSGVYLSDGVEVARDSKLCDLEDTIDIKYVENEPMKFYVVNNLRSQQDKTSFDVYRYNSLDEAYKQYSKFADQYTSALGINIAPGREIDLVHSRGGEPVLVTDYRRIDGFKDNPLVQQTVDHVIGKLGIQREGNYELFNQWVEIPLASGEIDNSILDYKRLLPKDPRHPISAINEAFCDRRGWINADDLFKELSEYDPYNNPVHLKISQVNVDYVRVDTYGIGQMDITPAQFGVMLERFKEMDKKMPLDRKIVEAQKKREDSSFARDNNKSRDDNGER